MDKLVGNERKILYYIYKHQNQDLNRFNILDKLNISNDEVKTHLNDLLRKKYIYYAGLNDSIALTSEGLSYFSLETTLNIETIIKSILCPIIVSAITTLITLWLKSSL